MKKYDTIHANMDSVKRTAKFSIQHLWIFGAIFVLSFFLFPSSARAVNPPAIISYQGKLLVGGASATTSYNMAFLIYQASSGGSPLYTASGTLPATSTISVTPVNGIFSVDLGGSGTNTLTTSTFSNYSNSNLKVYYPCLSKRGTC